jgi:hypothetical protein
MGVGLVVLALATGCGGNGDKNRFCELAREREAKQPQIDFGKASSADIRSAFSAFVSDVAANVAEAKRTAPKEIAADFTKAVEATRSVAQTGDAAPLMTSEAARHVGEYLSKECGIGGP